MKHLYWLDDAEWAKIEPYLPRGRRGAHRVDDRRVISGIIHMLRTGARWRDCPAAYGPYTTIYNRFHRWSQQGVWFDVFQALTGMSGRYVEGIASVGDRLVLQREPERAVEVGVDVAEHDRLGIGLGGELGGAVERLDVEVSLQRLGELLVLPDGLKAKQWVAHAGLDPRPRQSGNVDAPRHISRTGNRHLRLALFMPALVAIQRSPQIKACYEALLTRGDHYMHLADLAAYLEADRRLLELYAEPEDWARKAIKNVASSGGFSSDRTIAEYAAEVWDAKPCAVP